MALRIDASDPQSMSITFRLPADDPPAPVSVVGSFNDWTPGAHELSRTGNGEQQVTATVAYGRTVHFRYLAADGLWFDDPDADETTAMGSVLHPRDAPNTGPEANQNGPSVDGPSRVRQAKPRKAAPKKAKTQPK